jgi:hypothetical protein
MWFYIVIIVIFCSLLSAIIYLANKNGRNSEKAERLKEELRMRAEGQARANKIVDGVRMLTDDECRRRLHEISDGTNR